MEALWRNRGNSERQGIPGRALPEAAGPAKRQRRSVAQEVTQILSEALEPPKALSILDLRGLGKEDWRGIDAAAHVAHERAAWD